MKYKGALMVLMASCLALFTGHDAVAEPVGEQFALTEGGGRSGLTALALDEVLRKADLRKGIKACINRVYTKADVRIYGTLHFAFSLYPGGGVKGVRFSKSGLERMGLDKCIQKVLQKRLHGKNTGVAAFLSGQLTIKPGKEDEFGFSVSARLSPQEPRSPPALNGSFWTSLDGPVSLCSIGSAALVLRLTSSGALSRKTYWAYPEDIPVAVEHCLVLAEQNDIAKVKRKSRRRRRRSVRRKVADCLQEILKAGQWQDKAYAAEEIADSWRFRARREIRKTIQDTLRADECDGHDQKDLSDNTGDNKGHEHACFVAPTSSAVGHALVRMLRAQLRLGLRPAVGVMESLARHPDSRVRLRLVDTVLARWKKGVPEGLALLVHDPDIMVSTRAQQIGCIKSNWESLHAFEEKLSDPDPVARAMAILNARACAARDSDSLSDAIRREKEPVLRMLMLRVLPVGKNDMIVEYAGPALFDPCPAVRYLALGLMARLSDVPMDLIRQLRKREKDPFILKQADRILAGDKMPRDSWEQLWLVQFPVQRSVVGKGVEAVGKLGKKESVSAN